MKVLMFGWEFPPHILGGLGTASYGLTKGMSQQEDMEITFCIPRPWGDEDQSFLRIIGMNSTPVVWRDVNWDYVQGRVGSYMNPQLYYDLRDHIYADFNYLHTNDLGCIEFSGRYPANLHEEINNYSIVAGVVARQQEFEIIHSHDWLTYPAGIHAKQVSGKPLVIHVHATDFDRSRGNVNPTVYAIEKNGMDHADHIMCVSELTRQTVIHKYFQDPRKVSTVHNAVSPLPQEIQDIVPQKKPNEKVVTFLGRITMQKGPEYFVEAAAMVLHRTRNIRFVMAGNGDMMNQMIRLVAERGIADRFHFPGFIKGRISTDSINRICHSVDIPIIGLNTFLLWKLCSVVYLPLSLNNPVVPRFWRNVLRPIIGISTLWQMRFMLSVLILPFMNTYVMKVRRKWMPLSGKMWD